MELHVLSLDFTLWNYLLCLLTYIETTQLLSKIYYKVIIVVFADFFKVVTRALNAGVF
jgi:energy-converting hydrogenase Eha subunit E